MSSTLGEAVEFERGVIQTGPFGSQLHQSDYTNDGVPVVMPKDIADGSISTDAIARVSEETATRLSRHQLQPRTVVLPRRGAITKCAFVRDEQCGWLCGTGCLQIVLEGRRLLPEYLYRYLQLPAAVRWLEQHAVGTTMLNLSAAIVAGLPLKYPHVSAQQRIITVLDSYDDLIENNRRRMALLEDAARQLYREWFVRLRFPGYEHTRLLDGAPESWHWLPLSALCTAGDGIRTGPFGSQLHQSDYTDDGVPVVMPRDLLDYRISVESVARIPEELANKLGRHRMSAGDTVYGRRGDVGRRAFIGRQQVGWFCGTGCLRMRPEPAAVNPRYLFDSLGSPQTAGSIANRAKGSTMPNLSAGAVKSVPVLVATRMLQDLYAEHVEPLAELRETLDDQNLKLRAARDLLLPRLMSGALAV